MAEHPMNVPVDPEATRAEMELALLDAQIVLALESAPRVAIPADFAARVSARAVESSGARVSRRQVLRLDNVRLKSRHYGRNTAVVSLCILLAMIAYVAQRSMGASVLWTSMEAIFCLQFALLSVWLVARLGVRNVRSFLPAFNSQS